MLSQQIPDPVKLEYPFSGEYLKLKSGHNYHYIDEGQGPVIVMVHGNPTWSFYYRNLIKHFSRFYRVIVPDHIGCGLSDKPQDYDYCLSNHVKNLEELLSHLGVKKFSMVVHDWGGAIGMGVATKRSSDLEKLIILNTAAFTDIHIPSRISICKLPIIGEKIVRHFNGFAWPATFMAVEKPLKKNVKRGYLYPYGNYKDRIATARFVKDIPMEDSHPTWNTLKSIENNLNSINCPKLILWGAKDFCFTTHFFQRWKEIYPEAQTHLYPDGGHYILEDEKDDVIKKMSRFLND